jgi:TetR/AcrR family transcriptional regulator, cholesterol catabolism regulator
MKERITEQSKALFEKKGFTETSIQDIVDALGVTKGTFYYYFSSKEELLMDIHIRYIENLLALQDKILSDDSKDCKSKLYDMVFMLIHSIEEQGASARVFFRELRNLSDSHLAQVLPKRDQFRLNLQSLLEQGIKSGEFRKDLEVGIVTFGILGITNWSYNWYNPQGSLKDHEVAKIYVEMILNGIEV